MADISQYLGEIMRAVYGEEVRGSIHDAIDIINKVGEKVLTIGTDVTTTSSSISGYYDGSLYINSNTYELWKCTGTSWELQGVLKGAKGNDGDNGKDGKSLTATHSKSGLDTTVEIKDSDGNVVDTFVISDGKSGTGTGDMLASEFVGNSATKTVHKADTLKDGSGTLEVQTNRATTGQALVFDGTKWTNGNVATDVEIDNDTIVKNSDNKLKVADKITEKIQNLDTNGNIDASHVVIGGSNVSVELGNKANTATTLSGYGITNAYTKTEVDNKLDNWYGQTPQATATGDQTVTFTGLDTSKAYELWFETSNGSQVGIKSSSLSGTTLSYVVSIPSDCPVPVNFKLRVVK